MIENQSDNIDNKETDYSNQDNTPEDIPSPEDESIFIKKNFNSNSYYVNFKNNL